MDSIYFWHDFLALMGCLDQEPDFVSFHRLKNNEPGLTLINSQAKTSEQWMIFSLSQS